MAKQEHGERIPQLDGLRGVAVLAVLLFHYITQQGPTPSGTIAHYLQRAVIIGWSGVDLFFVLSGFLIGGVLMSARLSSSYYRTFYARRFFRIIPIYYLWITAYIFAIAVIGAKIQVLSNSGIRPPLDIAIFANYWFLQNLGIHGFGGLAGAWFGHLWSLAVEEQFYLVAPLVVRFANPRRLPVILAGVIVGAPATRSALVYWTHSGLGTTLMPCRADALALGMVTAALWRSQNMRAWLELNRNRLYGLFGLLFTGMILLWFLFPESGTRGMQTFGFTWLGMFYAVVLLLSLSHADGPIAACLRNARLRELGKVSYCIYIIHIVVNVVCHAMILHTTPKISTAKGALVTLFAAFLSYGLAKVSWIVYENPLVRKGHGFKY
jgi:peptidoglycan/LPS O-acetylase OafA/YrhL